MKSHQRVQSDIIAKGILNVTNLEATILTKASYHTTCTNVRQKQQANKQASTNTK